MKSHISVAFEGVCDHIFGEDDDDAEVVEDLWLSVVATLEELADCRGFEGEVFVGDEVSDGAKSDG